MTNESVQDIQLLLQIVNTRQSHIVQTQLSMVQSMDQLESHVNLLCSRLPEMCSSEISGSLAGQMPSILCAAMPNMLRDAMATTMTTMIQEMGPALNRSTASRPLQATLRNVSMKGFEDMETAIQASSKAGAGGENTNFHSHLNASAETDLILFSESLPRTRKRNVQRLLYRASKLVNLGFATAVLQISLYEVQPQGTSNTSLRRIESSLTIIPSRLIWLLSHGAAFSVFYTPDSSQWCRSIRYFPIVPESARILQLSEQGRVEEVRKLLCNGEASVFDTDPRGLTPLQVSIPRCPC